MSMVLGIALLLPIPVAAKALLACGDTAYSVIVHVHGVKNENGSVTVALYDDNPKRFLKKKAKLGQVRVPARRDVTTVCFAALHPGDYAVAIYHDEDGDGKLTRSWIGIPTEGFGFSNNPEVFLAPPDHSEVVFFIELAETVLNIRIQY